VIKKLSLKPDPHMRWIYAPTFWDDPQAENLRKRREAAIRDAPRWLIELALLNDADGAAQEG
jgi:hypothetical protein